VEQLTHKLGKKLAKMVGIMDCCGFEGAIKAARSGLKAGGGVHI
jgi:hypothetical protein